MRKIRLTGSQTPWRSAGPALCQHSCSRSGGASDILLIGQGQQAAHQNDAVGQRPVDIRPTKLVDVGIVLEVCWIIV